MRVTSDRGGALHRGGWTFRSLVCLVPPVARRAAWVTPAALALLISGYALAAGSVALQRHWNLQSQALDMGYASQVTWNALHGNGLRFTVFRGDVGAQHGRPLEYGPGADRDSLFAYHVELLFFPISLLYLVHAGPETLIALLTVALALGALPAYWIARRQLGHPGAALAFAAMYLLFPSVQAANVADFHVVSLTPPLLLLALHFLLTARYGAFVAVSLVCAAAKEEVGLLVGMMGLYAWIVQRQRRLGLAVAGASFAWVALCFLAIIPRFSGGVPSLFWDRYADAWYRISQFPGEALAGRLVSPLPDYTLKYVAHLLAGTGYLALLGPWQLALATPALAVNGLSGFTWQHGGGAHYSAEVVPAVLVAAICGTRWLAQVCWRRFKVPPSSAALAIALVGLLGALAENRREGVLPPAQRFAWPAPSEHAARLGPLLARIPPPAIVSAQSNVYPHLSAREKIYVFPVVDDAEYVLVDVAGASDPLPPGKLFPEVQAMLADPRFDLLAGDDGFLLFRRQAPEAPNSGRLAGPRSLLPPASFLSFTRASAGERFTPAQVSLEGLFEVAGYRLEPLPEVNFSARRVTPVVYVRALRAIDGPYRFATCLAGRDNAPGACEDTESTQLWYPPDQWQVGELLRLRFPPVVYRPGDRLGVGVRAGGDAAGGGGHVRWLEASGAPPLSVHEGRVALLGRLP